MPAHRRLAIAVIACVGAAGSAAHADHVHALRLGIVPFADGERLARQFDPIASHLERALDRPARLQTAPNLRSFIMRIEDGAYDVVFAGAHIAALAIADFGYQPLAKSPRTVTAGLYVRTDAPVTSFDALRGRTVAAPESLALPTILVERALAANGLEPGRDFTLVNAASGISAALMVANGAADAAVISDAILDSLAPELRHQMVRLLAVETDYFAAMVAAPQLDAGEVKAVRQALLAFFETPEGRAYKKRFPAFGLTLAEPSDFKPFHVYLPLLRMRLAASVAP